MKFKNIALFYAIASSLILAGCGGDINISEGDIITTTTTNNTGGGTGGSGGSGGGTTDPVLPGEPDGFLSNQVSNALGQTVQVRSLVGVLTDTVPTKSLDGDGRIGVRDDPKPPPPMASRGEAQVRGMERAELRVVVGRNGR